MPDHDYIAAALARRTATAPIIQPMVLQPQSGGVIKNAAGTTLADSTGLVSGQIMSQPATPFLPGTVDPWNVTLGPALIQGSPSNQAYQVTFTLSRPSTLLLMASLTAKLTTTGSAFTWTWGIATDSTTLLDSVGFSSEYDSLNGGYQTTTNWEVITLPAGFHSYNLLGGGVGALQTVHINGAAMYTFLLGS